MAKRLELVLGGARSGKSRYAEQQASAAGCEVVYIATATIHDDEMQKRIQRHQQDRPSHWQTIEEPLSLAASLQAQARDDRCLLIDCLTLWVTNLLMLEDPARFAAEKQAFLDILPQLPGQIILVSNEVGQGIVPMGELSRRFVDESGWLHQAIAAMATDVTLVVAGIPMTVKSSQTP